MKGFVLKDFYLMKSMIKTYLLMIAVFVGLSFVGVYNASFVSSIMAMLLIMMPINSFAYDEQAKWDKYAAATPRGRAGQVGGKYLFSTILALTAIVLVVLLQTVLYAVGKSGGQSLGEMVCSGVGAVGYGFLINAILLPLIFKFGVQKSRVFMMIAIGLAVSSMVVASIMLEEAGMATTSILTLVFGLIPVLGLLLMIPSYFVALRVYQKQDL